MADWFAAGGTDAAAVSTQQIAPQPQHDEIPFCSRRSPVLCRKGCVASSQPLASSIGLDMLRKGANAAEAAIAVAAALCVTEPCSTGLGGDMFCLYYNSEEKKVYCINGSGRSPAGLTLDILKRDWPDGSTSGGVDLKQFCFSPHSVTVPGAARGYEDLLHRHGTGRFTLAELLEPAAELAEEGFPVAGLTSYHWNAGVPQLQRWVQTPGDPIPLTVDGTRGPKEGEIFTNPDLARVLRDLGRLGATQGFYQGPAGQAIAEALQGHGGVMTAQDLANHTSSTFPNPIALEYRGVKLWQVPPNGQGIAGLIALSGLNHLEETGACPRISPDTIGKADAYHVMIEMMRLGFADARKYIADPDHSAPVTNEWMLDPERIGQRAKTMFDPSKATIHGAPLPSSCTVSFQVVDRDGNAISFVNSNFMGFGSGIVPKGCGFSLQNRGFGFSVEPDHPNVIASNKRPYHTIIPGLMTHADTGELYCTLSNMGGNMQPQGHLQLAVGMLAGGLNPQEAIDLPRFCIADGTKEGGVSMEAGVGLEDIKILIERGHLLSHGVVGHARSVFGRAQIIKRDRTTGVLWAGSDGRADGCAMGY